MGISVLDVAPVASYGPTAQTPPGKPDLSKYFRVARTDTAAGIVKAVVPASASVVLVTVYGSTISDAATTATVTLTVTDNTGTRSAGTVDVKTNGATTALVQMSNLPLLTNVPATGDLKITAQYAETGTASTAGGPWTVRVLYAP